jgi:hypothetical protein
MCLRVEHKCQIKLSKRKYKYTKNFLTPKEKNLTIGVTECLLHPTGVIVFCTKHSASCVARHEMSQSEKYQAHRLRCKDNILKILQNNI